MLQVRVLTFVILLAAQVALAQSGVVTSMQRPGGVSQALLDKLNRLETKYAQVSTLMGTYTTTLITNPNSCSGTATLYTSSCETLPIARRLLEVSITSGSTSTGGNLTASGASHMKGRVQWFLNNNGCPTASNWSLCTDDHLRQVYALRLTGYAPAVGIAGRFFPMDPNYIVWGVSTPGNDQNGATSLTCNGMQSNAADPFLLPNVTMSSTIRHNLRYGSCDTNFPLLCCRFGT